MVSLSPENTPADLANMRCKHYYKLHNKNSTVEPTGIKTWKKDFADDCSEWEKKFSFYIIQQEIINYGSSHSSFYIEF